MNDEVPRLCKYTKQKFFMNVYWEALEEILFIMFSVFERPYYYRKLVIIILSIFALKKKHKCIDQALLIMC